MPTVLQVIGLIAIFVGVYVIWWPAAIILGGLAILMFGVLLEMNNSKERRE